MLPGRLTVGHQVLVLSIGVQIPARQKIMVLLESKNLPIGWQAPDFKLTDGVSQKSFSLADFADKQGLLIIFTCNHCPYAKAAWPLIIELHKQFSDKISFLAVNPNNWEDYPEDSPQEMKKKMDEWRIQFPYLFDGTQQVARRYQAECTPDPYLFKNNQGKFELFYHGRINDNWQEPEKARASNLRDALSALIAGQAPPKAQPPSMGCSVKWRAA